MWSNMILHSLLAFTLLVQSAARESVDWKDLELVAFLNGAMNHFARSLSPIAFHELNFTAISKCAHAGHNPYGIAKATILVSCPVDAVDSCELFGEQKLVDLIVECQYMAEIPGPIVGKPLGAMCYLKFGGNRKEQDPETMCRRWRYPGSQVPRLQVPEHLKSVYSRILAYQPTSLERYNHSLPSSSTPRSVWPKNEHERTGFGGIGRHSTLGPNKALFLLITSEDQFGYANEDQFGHSHGTTKVLIEDSDVFTAIPHFRPKKADINDDYILRKLKTLATDQCEHEKLEAMVESRREYHRGYLKSRFNTDNAWSEGVLVHVHDEFGGCFSPYPIQSDARSRSFKWKQLDQYVTPSDFAGLFIANYK